LSFVAALALHDAIRNVPPSWAAAEVKCRTIYC